MSRVSFYSEWTPRLLSVLRVAVALLFIEHGSQKLLGFPPAQQAASDSLTLLMWMAGMLEFFGGLLILFGLFTRPVAFLLSGEMGVAYFMAHVPQGFFPLQNRGELAALYSFVFLFLAVAGGGAWSLDNLLWWRSGTAPSSATLPKTKSPELTRSG
ncbi:MAG: putative oxidoreductase [Rubrobacteraceae bacterium]|nr:putative oxidoreductase [Rubrobacteraceae bacterium]